MEFYWNIGDDEIVIWHCNVLSADGTRCTKAGSDNKSAYQSWSRDSGSGESELLHYLVELVLLSTVYANVIFHQYKVLDKTLTISMLQLLTD